MLPGLPRRRAEPRAGKGGVTSHLKRMQSPLARQTGPATIGVEAFDAAGFQASDDSPHAVECELVEDGGAFVAHRPTDADRPRRVAFVDGTLRTEARLPVRLPDHRAGWRWKPYAVDGADIDAAGQQLQRLMRDAEADIAEALSNEGWLTVLDGPLHGIRHRSSVALCVARLRNVPAQDGRGFLRDSDRPHSWW